MNCKLIRLESKFTGKDGKQKTGYDYYLTFENGEYIAIMPKWTKNSNDFIRLRAFSDLGERK